MYILAKKVVKNKFQRSIDQEGNESFPSKHDFYQNKREPCAMGFFCPSKKNLQRQSWMSQNALNHFVEIIRPKSHQRIPKKYPCCWNTSCNNIRRNECEMAAYVSIKWDIKYTILRWGGGDIWPNICTNAPHISRQPPHYWREMSYYKGETNIERDPEQRLL